MDRFQMNKPFFKLTSIKKQLITKNLQIPAHFITKNID